MKKSNIKKLNIKKIKGITVALCTISIASGVLLGACGSAEQKETTTQEVVTQIEEIMESGSTESTTLTTQSKETGSEEATSSETTQSESTETTSETIRETNPPEWVVDEDTGMLIDNSNFIVEDSNGVEHVMTRDQYKQWLNGEYTWD